MKEAGLLFTASMIRAVLRAVDPKTQTRRLRGLEKINQSPGRWSIEQQGLIDLPGAPYTGKRGVLFRQVDDERLFVPALHAPETILWVREAWRMPITLDEFSGSDMELRAFAAGTDPAKLPLLYEADGERRRWNSDFESGRYRHGRFMPRWASRINLQYVDERVERLQDISERDAQAEGINLEGEGMFYGGSYGTTSDTAKDSYRLLWEQINGVGSWEINPWIRVLEFRRLEHA